MGRVVCIIGFIIANFWMQPLWALVQGAGDRDNGRFDQPAGVVATDSSILVSSYFNALDPRDEWTELVVAADNVDMRNWTLQDNNSAQTTFQPAITFNNIAFWNNMRAGTVIMIWHRQVGSAGNAHPTDNTKADGYVEMAANDPAYFNGGTFGTAPAFSGATLNIAGAGDLLQLLTSTGTFVHALGHKATFGSSWTPLPLPKLNYKASLADGEAVFVCPGGNVNEFGHLTPQDGTTWTAKSATDLSFGLPNCETTTPNNSNFWHHNRQPFWINPILTGTVNGANTQVTLNWNASVDPFPSDGTQGYMILRNSANLFGGPLDGHTYNVGDIIGGATVIAIIPSSQTLTFTDNISVPCSGPLYYQIYAFRYTTDALGNDLNGARGRAYNETSYGVTQVTFPAAVAPSSATSDRNNICADDPGNITLSASAGSGTTLNWYSGSCGGAFIGSGSGPGNSITIPSPMVTTTYYARWENLCGPSSCADVTVTVLPATTVSLSITASANPVCTGTPVTFTAIPVNPGTTPVYQWKVNGINAGTNNPVYTYTPLNGDDVMCILTSSASCATGSPASSNNIIMSVTSSIPVSVTITADANPVCVGTTVTFTATPVNPGTSPVYQWKVNGTNAGTNSTTYAYIPLNGDNVTCTLNSNASCASGSPATSNNIIMSVTTSIPVSVSIAADANPVCTGTIVNFTATPVNPGSTPAYQWKVNGTNAGTNSPNFSFTPQDGDDVSCILTSNASCGTGSPATSNNVIMSVTNSIPVALSIVANVNPVCMGSPVTFTATPTNPGTTPVYQWKVNGANAGTNNPVYTYIPNNGDIVTCILTSNASCGTGSPATSNAIIMMVSSDIPVTVTIVPNANPVCAGTAVVFTATPFNPGTAPGYQWKVNGTNSGGNNPVFSYVPANGDVVTCILTSNASCASVSQATSNPVTMSVSASMPLSVVIDATPGLTICQGTVVTFTATTSNGGTGPSYQWKLNGISSGGNSATWSAAPADGDRISCVVTSNSTCASNNPASSNTLTVTVSSMLVPAISITANHVSLCPGTLVTFTATPNNGGSTPLFEWLIDGVQVQQGTSPVFTSNSVQPGEQVTCRLTSSLTCVSQPSISSSPLSLAAAPPPEVKLSDQDYLCTGTTTPLDAGADFVSYLWQDNTTQRFMNITGTGWYKVVVTDTLGCKGSDSVEVRKCSGNVYVPNAFSPNGDGLNDVFRVYASPDDVTDFFMQIFNRWGEKIFESYSLLSGWDGTKQGTFCPADSYSWILTYHLKNSASGGETITTKGTIQLVR